MRRIEAISGRKAEQLVAETFKRQKDISRLLQTSEQDLRNKIESVLQEFEEFEKSWTEKLVLRRIFRFLDLVEKS